MKKSTVTFVIVAAAVIAAFVVIVLWKKLKDNKSDEPGSVVNDLTGGLPAKKQFASGDYVKTTTALNFRQEPNAQSTIWYKLPKGTILTATTVTDANGWIGVKRKNGDTGFVYSGYLVKTTVPADYYQKPATDDQDEDDSSWFFNPFLLFFI